MIFQRHAKHVYNKIPVYILLFCGFNEKLYDNEQKIGPI